MPCRSEHKEPSQREKEASRVYAFLDELRTGHLIQRHYDGYHPKVYAKKIEQKELDDITEKLCTTMTDVEDRRALIFVSLELQLWWRDHKRWDKRRKEYDARQRLQRELKSAMARMARLIQQCRDANVAVPDELLQWYTRHIDE
jgi:hypothetical protein